MLSADASRAPVEAPAPWTSRFLRITTMLEMAPPGAPHKKGGPKAAFPCDIHQDVMSTSGTIRTGWRGTEGLHVDGAGLTRVRACVVVVVPMSR